MARHSQEAPTVNGIEAAALLKAHSGREWTPEYDGVRVPHTVFEDADMHGSFSTVASCRVPLCAPNQDDEATCSSYLPICPNP